VTRRSHWWAPRLGNTGMPAPIAVGVDEQVEFAELALGDQVRYERAASGRSSCRCPPGTRPRARRRGQPTRICRPAHAHLTMHAGQTIRSERGDCPPRRRPPASVGKLDIVGCFGCRRLLGFKPTGGRIGRRECLRYFSSRKLRRASARRRRRRPLRSYVARGSATRPLPSKSEPRGGRDWLRELGLRHAPGGVRRQRQPHPPRTAHGSNAPVEILEHLSRSPTGSSGIPSAKELADGTCLQDSH
jgi:hypothetical protein